MKQSKLIILILVSSFIFSIGLILVGLRELISDHVALSNAKLIPGNYLYKKWIDSSKDTYLNFYLFNLTNGHEFEKNGAKPFFEEIGPFVYKETRIKENITYNKNGTITYKEKRIFHFCSNLSAYSNNIEITTINLFALSIIKYVKYSNFDKILVNSGLKYCGETLLIKQTVENLLFGYEDKFIKFLHVMNYFFVPSGSVSFFYKKNNTIDGEYTIFDGVNDPNKVGLIEHFNGMNKLSYWSTDSANKINGTDSTINYPLMNKSSSPYSFHPDICRSTQSFYNESLNGANDIELYGYILDENFLANSSINQDNKGFCTPIENCLFTGIMNITNCNMIGKVNLPIYISLPHFLFGDESLTRDVDGLKADFSKHKFIIYYEPTTGIPMKANKRIQMNAKLERDDNIDLTKNLSELYFPLYWIDENFKLDRENVDSFYVLFVIPFIIYDIIKYILFAIGLLGTIICFADLIVKNRSKKIRFNSYSESEESSTIEEMNEEVNEQTSLLNNASNDNIETKTEYGLTLKEKLVNGFKKILIFKSFYISQDFDEIPKSSTENNDTSSIKSFQSTDDSDPNQTNPKENISELKNSDNIKNEEIPNSSNAEIIIENAEEIIEKAQIDESKKQEYFEYTINVTKEDFLNSTNP